jgi:glutamate-ammonia-ligase adenylyltransferase
VRGDVKKREPKEIAELLSTAYPALAPFLEAHPEDLALLARGGVRAAREPRFYRRAVAPLAGQGHDEVKSALRVLARREKLRIALRELCPPPGCDVDVTAAELSDLAEACIGAALDEALAWADARFGVPTSADGTRCPVVVLGMGKLGGRELNAGSDVDLMVFYGSDDGAVLRDGKPTEASLHEHFTRVTQRLIATIDEPTADGRVWPVDMRLRPEGGGGPLVNSLAAAERYYETWGRTWERAALLRARPVGGDAAFGKELVAALSPFVWRRAVDPRIVDEMILLVERARVELSAEPERDLKLGVGGIREAEFFVQALQLVWGGRDPRLRSTNTLAALRRLKARGFVTDREGEAIESAYLLLRRLEHRVQFATGLQTHELPRGELEETIARSLGFEGSATLEEELDRRRGLVHRALTSLRQPRATDAAAEGETTAREDESDRAIAALFAALDAREEEAVLSRVFEVFGHAASLDLPRHLLQLSRRPDAPLGTATRDRLPGLGAALVRAIADAADPEQAARFWVRFFAHLATPSVYARAFADDPHQVKRLTNLFGASAFLGEVVVGHPEISDRILFGRGVPGAGDAENAVDEEIAALSQEDALDPDRRAPARQAPGAPRGRLRGSRRRARHALRHAHPERPRRRDHRPRHGVRDERARRGPSPPRRHRDGQARWARDRLRLRPRRRLRLRRAL